MLKTTLYVGLDDQNTKKQEILTKVAKECIQYGLLNIGFSGATLTLAQGLYTYQDKEFVSVENTFKIELLCFEDESSFMGKVYKLATVLKDMLNQETIAITKEYIESELF